MHLFPPCENVSVCSVWIKVTFTDGATVCFVVFFAWAIVLSPNDTANWKPGRNLLHCNQYCQVNQEKSINLFSQASHRVALSSLEGADERAIARAACQNNSFEREPANACCNLHHTSSSAPGYVGFTFSFKKLDRFNLTHQVSTLH